MIQLIGVLGIALGGAGLLLCYLIARAALFVAVLSALALGCTYWALGRDARRRLGVAPLAIAPGLPVFAWLLPSAWLLYALMAALVPVLVRRREQVAPLYLFALLLLPGLDQTVAAGSLKLFEFGVHDALACGAAAALMMRPRVAGRLSLDLPFVGVLLVLMAAAARDTSATNAIRVLVNTGLDYGLPYFIISRGVRSLDDVRRVMLNLTAGAAVLSVVLLYEVYSSWPIYNVLYERYGIAMQLVVKSRGGVLRAGGPFLESTSIAMVLVFCFLAAWSARGCFRSSWHHRALLALLVLGLLAPQSRGAWFGLLAGMAVIDLYRGRPWSIVRRSAMLAVPIAVLFMVAQGRPQLAESVGLSGGSAETAEYRQRLFDRGLVEFRDSPLVGFSSPELLVRLADLKQGENIIDFVNTYIYVALVSGAVGLAMFVGAFVFYLRQLWRRRRAWDGEDAWPAAFAFGAIATPMEMLFFTSFGGRPATFVFVFFALAAAIALLPVPQRRVSARNAALAAAPTAMPAPPAANSNSSSRTFRMPARRSAIQP